MCKAVIVAGILKSPVWWLETAPTLVTSFSCVCLPCMNCVNIFQEVYNIKLLIWPQHLNFYRKVLQFQPKLDNKRTSAELWVGIEEIL